MHIIEQAGIVHNIYLEKEPQRYFHPCLPKVSGLLAVQLAINSTEGVKGSISDDAMLTVFGQVDSLFYNTWMRSQGEVEVLKKIAVEKGIVFGQI